MSAFPVICPGCGLANHEGATACIGCGLSLLPSDPRNPLADASLFIGRRRELDSLRRSLDAAFAGHGRLMLLVGEAGIGKTWIARELARYAAERGATVLWGRCFEDDWQPAYGPWAEAIGEFARSASPEQLQRLLGSGAPTLARLVPQLRNALPDTPEAPSLLPDDERVRLYDATIRFVLAIAEDKPLLLVIDDLHWADRDSLRLLRYLARSLPSSRILALGTYRDPEIDLAEQHPLADLLPVLRRETDYQQINVRGFTKEDVGAYLSHSSGRPLPAALVQAIYQETVGNPFYVREVLRHLTEEGKIHLHGDRWFTDLSLDELGIPEGIRQLVHRRLSRLSVKATGLLRLAAGFTGSFDFPTLQALTDLTEELLLDCIDEGLRAGLLRVSEDSPPSYEFAHAIVRHTLYDELNPDRRARLHRRIAGALEQVYAGREQEHATELASQYHASASLPGALNGFPYALAAAEQARAASAHDRAATFLRMARNLSWESPPPDRAKAFCKLAVAEAEALMLDEAQRSVDDALNELSRAGADPTERAGFLAQAARALKDGGARPAVWKPLIEQGLALLGTRRDLLWAQLMLLRDRFEPVSIGPINTVRWLGHDPQAVTIAREQGDEDDYARTLEPLDWRTREETAEVLALVRMWRRPAAIMRAMDVVGRDLLKRHGAHREALELYSELLQTAERFGSIQEQAEALLQIAITQIALGEFPTARKTARQAQEMILRLGPAHELRFGVTALNSILTYFLDGDWEKAATAAAQFAASPQAARNPRGLVSGAYAALGYVRFGNPAEAKRLLAALTPLVAQMEPTMYVHHAAIAFGGSAVWEIGEVEFAADYRRVAMELIAAGFGDSILSPELTVARMAALLGRVEESRDYFVRARAHCETNGLKAVRAIADYDEALALLRMRSADHSLIRSLLSSAQTVFQALGMEGWAHRALRLEEGLADTPPPGIGLDRSPINDLTTRESEVLRLLAMGRTNNEIAEELVLSVRTVERHIANIYAKISAHGRADATAYALGRGIVSLDNSPNYAISPMPTRSSKIS